jgi:ribosome-associated heat shock protein Hsp15
MRLDRFLWFARLSATRAYAQALATGGHLRIDGRPSDKPSASVRVGHVLTYADHRGIVRSVRVTALPARRGPPAEARLCYIDLIDAASPPT